MEKETANRQKKQIHRHRQRKKAIAGLVALVLVILGLVLFFVCLKGEDKQQQHGRAVQQEPPRKIELSVLCAGDVMSHMPQTNAQYNASTGEYDYTNNFQYVKPYIEEADLALCNVETTFAGKPYSGFPQFSSPDALAAALAGAGFDVGFTANNHMADRGFDGILRTMDVLEEQGLTVVGTVREPDAAPYVIKEVKGIKIGLVAYTYETGSGADGTVSINGSVVSPEVAARLKSFHFSTLDADVPRIRAAIEGARSAGAQVIIVYYHWGEEYQEAANQHQKELAQKTADMGADVIFASHPHVLQETDWLTAAGSGKKVPVFYSMGNFISNQRAEFMHNRYTEEGLMARVNITCLADGGVTDISMDGIPTWVDKYYAGGKTIYTIVPLADDWEDNEALQASGHLSKARQAREDAYGILGFDSEEN